MPPVREKRRVDTKDKRRETTRDCRVHEQRSSSGQLINRVVTREKRVSEDPLLSDSKGRERKIVPARSTREFQAKAKMEKRTWRELEMKWQTC